MDIDISRWILEFLLRQPGLDKRTINSMIRVLPLDDSNSSLKKGILLKKIESEISDGLVSEEILVYLEQIEELDHREGIEILESMKKAYCHVAVECTVRFLEGGEADMEDKYFDAVKRIWRVRASGMEKFEMGVGLVSKGLKEWNDTIAAGVCGLSVGKDILVMSRGVNALEAVRGYVNEAKERMGPSFLEVMAETLTDDSVREALGWRIDEVRDQGRETAPGVPYVDGVRDRGRETAPSVPNAEKDVVTDGVRDRGRETAPSVPNTEKDVVTDGVRDRGRETAPSVPNADKDVVTDGVRVRGRETAPSVPNAEKDVVTDGVRDRGRETAPSVPNAEKDVVTDGVCDEGRESAPNVPNAGENAITVKGDKEIHEGHVGHKRKYVPTGRRRIPASISRDVKIVDTEELARELHDRYRRFSTPETNRVQESLKSSFLELKAVVHDPLPDALRLAETLRSGMTRENVDHEQAVENERRLNDVAPSTSAGRSADIHQDDEGNLVIGLREKNNVPNPSLMARNSTAHVVEWDSVSGFAEASPRRPHLPSPEHRVISPLNMDEMAKLARRRKSKRWSILEEDTLRAGVRKYGEGQWKLILSMYLDIFEGRTECDLKDKWRNMIRR